MAVRNRFLILLKSKEAKEGRRIFLKEVAQATGVSENTLVSWSKNELNRYDAPVIEALCDYFGCELSELLFIERPKS